MSVRGLQAPILARVMQEDAPEADRVSVLSLAALVFRLAFVATGPAIGLLVDARGLTVALASLAVGCTALSVGALAAFSRARDAVAGTGDIRYRPEL